MHRAALARRHNPGPTLAYPPPRMDIPRMSPDSALPVSYPDIEAAAARIAPYVARTPVLRSRRLDELLGAEVHFKCENFQRIGAFKARGAHNAVFLLDDAAAARGVGTHSSGNHAAALSLAARNRGIAA